MPETIVSTSNLTKKYGDRLALNDVCLTVNRGEIFGFLGHNGAGKTTTIHLLTTLLKPTSGSATICGKDIVKESLEVRRHIGYVPENVRLYDALTTVDNLKFFARLSGIPHPDQRIGETLEFLDSTGLAHRRVGTLSKGLRQRVGLAQAIVHRPEVLFLDEPSSGLDPLGIKKLRELILRLNREFETTIFMNTHLISEMSKTCSTIGILSQGQLVYRDSIEQLTKRYGDEASLEALYLSVTPVREKPGAGAATPGGPGARGLRAGLQALAHLVRFPAWRSIPARGPRRGGEALTFKEVLAQVIDWLQQDQRISYGALKSQFDLDDDYLDHLKTELIYAKRVAVDEDERVLVWTGEAPTAPEAVPLSPLAVHTSPRQDEWPGPSAPEAEPQVRHESGMPTPRAGAATRGLPPPGGREDEVKCI